MYARYVPPPKGAATSPEPDHAAEPSNRPTLPQPTVYARYIPPPKSTKEPSQPPQHVHFDETDDIDEPPAKKAKLIENDESSKEPKQKSKKSKKTKKDAQLSANDLHVPGSDQPTTEPVIQNGINNDETPAELDTPDQPIAQESSLDKAPELVEDAKKDKKEKKGKKKSKRKDEAKAEAEVDDGTPIRHRSVLKKAAKSIQRAPESKPLPDEQDVSMQDAPEANGDADIDVNGEMDVDAKVPEVQGLQPLPQPEPIPEDTTKPSYETLPPWLAKPIRVSPQAIAPFTQFGLSPELGISPEVEEKMAANGYKEAFAIQTAVIPLLLPHHDKSMHGDVLVSAATGSGKTLAYTLPVVRDLSLGNRHVTRLRAVVVLPTRELVRQVQQVCEQCSGVFSLNGSRRRVRVGIAMGSQPFDHEQEALVERGEKHDPEAYAKRNKRLASESGYGSDEDSDEGYNTEDEEKATIRKREDKIQTLPDHVVSYTSKVDILICTPGRLVEHIKYTPGFSLDFVRWLIVDEADKLLGQHFQQWLDVVIPRLQSNENGARNHKQSNLSGVRKIVLSATMTKDLDRLEGLKLRWPNLVVLEGSGAASEPEATVTQADLALPELLEEAALKVSDSNLKPLFLLDLLQSEYIFGQSIPSRATQDPLDDDTSSSESDSDSDSDLETSFRPSRTTSKGDKPSILIFTKSNETALRLSRLLSLLAPALASLVGTLTSTTQYATRRRTIRSFLAGKLRILVASDLVARGIDLPSLDHVVNYDVPSSVASYVHRVGRTARAGKTGRAWTLYTNPEARWFWNEVASENAIQRSKKVERVRVTEEKEDAFEKKVAAYELALAKLGEEASESRTKTRARSQET